jgi:hypothetical protein
MNKRLFWILWLAGLAGILSFLLVDLTALIAAIPQPAGAPPPNLPPPALLKLLSVLQPAVLLTIAVLVGNALAGSVGLRAPAAEALAARGDFAAALRPQVLPGLVAGLACGVALVGIWVVAKPHFPPGFIARAEDFNRLLPHVTRFLYGGVTEELLLRWGLMACLVWVPWRWLQKGGGPPRAGWVVAAIVGSALVFGAGHLPVAALLAGGLTLPLVLYVVSANALFGIVAGFLFWRCGLESAILAHMAAHVVLIAAICLAF